MFEPIIIVVKCLTCIVRRVNIDALDLARELLFECFESKEIVPENETIIENVVVSNLVLGVIRLLGIFQQYTWLQLGPISFANPCQFQFLFVVCDIFELFLSDITRRR